MGIQISPFREEQDVNIASFLFLREEEGLREETQRLRRYQTLLEQWSETFTQEEHDVSACVGRLLKNMLKQVHKDIDYLSEVRRLQPLCLPSKHFSGMSPSAFRKMKKSMMEKFRPNMDELRRRQMYFPHLSLLSFKSDLTLTVLCTFGRFYQSSSKKARRSLAARNTRKWLRCLHTRTAGGAQRRSRRRLIDSGLKLRSHVTRGSGLSLKPGDRTDLSTSSVSHSQSLTPN
ncbi:hypothetical protein NQD34_009228 [Periophthalmus magnuspinnatus]|nr:hypothetical protein NQD34_009228 [Periophthalmus magnuspinnatus]